MVLDDHLITTRRHQDQEDNAKFFLGRIQAAADERLRLGSDMVIIAKTNMRLSYDGKMFYPTAVRRLERAVQAGADVVMMPGPILGAETVEHLRHTFRNVPMMRASHESTVERTAGLDFKNICYPELFTNALYHGLADADRHFVVTRGFGILSPLPKPDDLKDMGGLRSLLSGNDDA